MQLCSITQFLLILSFYIWFITKYRYDNFFAPSSRRTRSGSAQEHNVSTAVCRDEVKRLELNVVSVWSRSVFRSRLLFIFRVLTSEKLLVRLLSRTDQSYEIYRDSTWWLARQTRTSPVDPLMWVLSTRRWSIRALHWCNALWPVQWLRSNAS